MVLRDYGYHQMELMIEYAIEDSESHQLAFDFEHQRKTSSRGKPSDEVDPLPPQKFGGGWWYYHQGIWSAGTGYNATRRGQGNLGSHYCEWVGVCHVGSTGIKSMIFLKSISFAAFVIKGVAALKSSS